MEGLNINTTQNVAINYETADLGKRILARCLDLLFQAIYVIIYFVLFVFLEKSNASVFQDSQTKIIKVIITCVLMAPVFFYSLYFPIFMQGQTPGKRIVKIKIVKEDGSECSFGAYFLRWLIMVIDSFMYYAVGLVCIAMTQKNQRLGDLAAKTIVISERQKISIDRTVLYNIQEDYTPSFSQVLRLTDNDIRIISQTYATAKKNADFSIIEKLRAKIESVIGEYNPAFSDIAYIETVLKDYQFFSEKG